MAVEWVESGVRFIAEDPEVGAQREGFAADALGDRRMKEALSGHRWKLLDVRQEDVIDRRTGQVIPRAFEAGCDAHIAKPVRKATLLAAIDETLALLAAGASKPAPAAPAEPSPAETRVNGVPH